MKNVLQLWFNSSLTGTAFLKPVQNRQGSVTTFQFQLVNARFAGLLGRTTREFTRQPVDRLLPFVASCELTQRLLTVLESGNDDSQTCYQSEQNRHLRLTFSRLDNRIVVNLEEVNAPESTERPSASTAPVLPAQAAATFESSQLLQAVIDSSPIALALLRPIYQDGQISDFRYLVSNPRNARLTGFSQQTMLNQSLLRLFPHLLDNGIFDRMVKVALSGEAQHFELRDKLLPGNFCGDFALLRVGTDVLLSVQDVTRLKGIEDELRQANLQLEQRVAERTAEIRQLAALQQAILTHAGLAIAATDTHGIIQLVNPALESMTGYKADELIGKVTPGALREPSIHKRQIDELKPEVNEPGLDGEELITAYVRRNNFLRRENILLTKTGKTIPVISTVSGLYDDQGALIGFVDIATDITYLKNIEEALTQAQQRNELAIKAGKLSVWEWNLLTNELELPTEFYTNLNLPLNNAFQSVDQLLNLVHPLDLAFVKQQIQRILDGQKHLDLELRVVQPTTKSIHYLKVDGLRLHSECGSVQHMVGVLSDRTAQRQWQFALQESEQRYRSLVDNMKEAVFQTDATGLWIYLNPAWVEITGFQIEESLGTLFLNYVLPDDQARNLQLFEPLIKREKTYCRHEIRYIHKAGGYRWVEVFAQVTVNDRNEVTGTTGTLTDITERKKIEGALRESEQRFRQIADNVDELFWIRDVNEPRFLYMNATFEKYSGIPVEQLYENPMAFASVIVEEDRAAIVKAFLNNESGNSYQFRIHHQDGSIRWVNARLFSVADNEGMPTRRIGVATDITTAIEKEHILEETLQKERSLNALKSQFISTASHEFRTPLTSIISSVELVRHYVNQDNTYPFTPILNKHTDTILNQVLALDELIADTLTLSKIEEGKVHAKLEEHDLVALTNELLALNFGIREDKRQVELKVVGHPVAVRIDRKLMTHVLTNLISNAFKFSTKNPNLTIYFSTKAVTIAVTDQGIGIPQKDLPHLFRKFFRAANVTHIKGTGLGLAICHEYINLQQGLIEVSSTEGVGTTFTITLLPAK